MEKTMQQTTYHIDNFWDIEVDDFWDIEAAVWVATSEDVPGLATESETIEALSDKLRILVPELLRLNHVTINHITMEDEC
jgi:Domain of unknown function (DUF1902)